MRCLSYIGGTLLCSLEIHHPQAINKSRLAVWEKRVASFFSIHAFFPATFSSAEKSSEWLLRKNVCGQHVSSFSMWLSQGLKWLWQCPKAYHFTSCHFSYLLVQPVRFTMVVSTRQGCKWPVVHLYYYVYLSQYDIPLFPKNAKTIFLRGKAACMLYFPPAAESNEMDVIILLSTFLRETASPSF